MFNLLQSATDDQTALVSCMITLAVASVLVFASFHLGPAGRKLRNAERNQTGLRILPRVSVEQDQTRDRAA